MIERISHADSPYQIDLKKANTQSLPLQDIYILVNSSDGPVDILLPLTKDFPEQNLRVFVTDIGGYANVNAITTYSSGQDVINGTSNVVISTALGFNRIHIATEGFFTATGLPGGGGGGNALSVSMTYAQLMTNINAGTLITGQRILLTNYQCSTYIQFSGPGGTGVGDEVTHLGTVEPLLLTAIAPHELSLVAESLSHPEDLILYLADVADGDYEYASSTGKGCIIHRTDRKLSISRDYDWRSVVFRRWETVIGNGHFWSYLKVPGAAFIDIGCFSDSAVVRNITVASPLNLAGTDLGLPYWLDNTVIRANVVGDSALGISFGNTFDTTDFDNSYYFGNYYAAQDNILISTFHTQNVVTNLTGNRIAGTNTSGFARNIVGDISGNVGTSISENTGTSIQNNNVQFIQENNVGMIRTNALRTISNNVGSLIADNTNNAGSGFGSSISNNNVVTISTNSSQVINGNSGDTIDHNASSVISILNNVATTISTNSNTGNISENIAEKISNNTSNVANILNNTIGKQISGNSNSGSISNNNANYINSNSNQGDITENISDQITGNSCGNVSSTGVITKNRVTLIQNNANLGNVENNNAYSISSNAPPCKGISGNVSNAITGNTNNGIISNNNVQIIATNLNAGDISDNTGVYIQLNSGTGTIIGNTVNSIKSNTGGSILNNTGYDYHGNNIKGVIEGNKVQYLYGNSQGTASPIYVIQFCSGENIYSCILNGNIMNVDGRIGECTTSGVIQVHTFIDPIFQKTITPTGAMSSTTATKTMLDIADNKHYIAQLSGGALTFPTAVSN